MFQGCNFGMSRFEVSRLSSDSKSFKGTAIMLGMDKAWPLKAGIGLAC
jgi:hypothetical protein